MNGPRRLERHRTTPIGLALNASGERTCSGEENGALTPEAEALCQLLARASRRLAHRRDASRLEVVK